MVCYFGRLEREGIVRYTCDDVRQFQGKWKSEWRKQNRTDEIEENGGIDRYYRDYVSQIDDFLFTCECIKIPLVCEKCPSEDHEGHFCRCESRNIRLAKQIRAEGQKGAR